MPSRLHVRGKFALLETSARLSITDLERGVCLHVWPRVVSAEDGRDEGDDEEDEDDARASELVAGFALDPVVPRLALLWKRYRGAVPDPEHPVWCSARLELWDLATGTSRSTGREAAFVDTLLGIAPDGRVFTESQAAGIAAFRAFRPSGPPVDELDALLRECFRGEPFDSGAGVLSLAMGFDVLPHASILAFDPRGNRALSGSVSQYRSHLALIDTLANPRVLYREALEISGITPLPDFRAAIVLESSCWGPQRMSVWDVEPLARRRDLYVGPASGTAVRALSVDPDGAWAVALLTDGHALCAPVLDGQAVPFRVTGASGEDWESGPDELAVDYAAQRLAVVNEDEVSIFDFTGRVLGSLGRGTAVFRDAGRWLVLADSQVVAVHDDGARGTWVGPHRLLACAGSELGLVVADASGQVQVVRYADLR